MRPQAKKNPAKNHEIQRGDVRCVRSRSAQSEQLRARLTAIHDQLIIYGATALPYLETLSQPGPIMLEASQSR